MYGKNAIEYQYFTEISDILLDQVTTTVIEDPNIPNPGDLAYIDIYEDKINIIEAVGVVAHVITFDVLSVSVAGTFYIEAYQDGNYYQTFTGDSNGVIGFIQIINTAGLDTTLTFKLKATDNMTVELLITYQIQGVNGLTNYAQVSTVPTVLTGNVSLNNTLPDMKITDFFTGIMRQFNMTCVGLAERQFQVLPLEDWYNNGATIDVTKYTDAETAELSRVPLFRNIGFRYQKSESFTNRNYFAISNSEYGDTDNVYSYDGGDYKIESPFENLLFFEAVGTVTTNTAILGYFLNQNYQSYIPKPTLLYLYGNTGTLPVPIQFYNGTTNVNLTNYTLFGQDVVTGGNNFSLNFGADNSIITKNTEQNGLFATYYFNYLSNLYNLKQRLTTIKAMLPLSIVTNLQLNDRLIIRDKRYIINDIKLELTSGEATLTLYNDFRNISLGNVDLVNNGINFITLLVPYREGNQSAIVTSDPPTLGIIVPNQTWAVGNVETKNVTLVTPVNTTGLDRQWVVTTTYVNGTTQTLTVIQSA